jgi:hypothetical protein
MSKLPQVALELYGLVPAEFTAARTALSKEAHGQDAALAKAIKVLPKPSTAAAVVNQLVRRRSDDIERLFELGAELRAAQHDLDRQQMQRLGRARQQLVAAVAQDGRAVAEDLGFTVSASALAEVEQTLQAALADPDGEAAVRTGYLTRALASTGLEPVDLSDAVAIPPAEGRPSAPALKNPAPKNSAVSTGTSARQAAAGRRAADARRETAARRTVDARRAADEASRRSGEAETRLAELDHRIDDLLPRRNRLEDELTDLERRAAVARSSIAALEREGNRLQRERMSAAERLETARARERRARARPGAAED